MVVTKIDYVVSGVWFSRKPFRHLTHVLIHKDKIGDGEKISVEEVARLLDKGMVIYSAYHHKQWNRFYMGNKLMYVIIENKPFVYLEGNSFFDYLNNPNGFNSISFADGGIFMISCLETIER